MRVVRLGVSVLKGAAQEHPDRLRLDAHGPVGDRRHALVDPATGRVLKTVENPRVLSLRASVRSDAHEPQVLVVDVPGHGRQTVPVRPAGTLEVDYWGRRRQAEVLGGEEADRLAAALGRYLGRDVLLVRARPRDLVWGEGATLVTTSSLMEVERRRTDAGDGGPARDLPALLEDAERWRAAIVVDTPGMPPFAEDDWHGRRLRVGPPDQDDDAGVVLEVTTGVARCAVVRSRPRDGARDTWDPLGLLAADRLRDTATGREVSFAVGAEVVRPGEVAVGDRVEVLSPWPVRRAAGPLRLSRGRRRRGA